MSCPVVKFITHTVSYLVFLTMLIVITFRSNEDFAIFSETSTENDWHDKANIIIVIDFRHKNESNTAIIVIQWLIVCWILGMLLPDPVTRTTLPPTYPSSYLINNFSSIR